MTPDLNEDRLQVTARLLFEHGADEDAKNILRLSERLKEQEADLRFEKDQAAIMRAQIEAYEDTQEYSLEFIERQVEARYGSNFLLFLLASFIFGGAIGFGLRSALK